MKEPDLAAQVATTVFVDGNNVMGARADGWWRNRAEAALRLVDDIAPVARARGGEWTIVFDGPGPARRQPPHFVAVVHVGHHRRNAADDRIVELIDALPRPETALVYTSDAGLRARVHELGAQVAGARPLLDAIAARRHEVQANGGGPPTEPSLSTRSRFHFEHGRGASEDLQVLNAGAHCLGPQNPEEEPEDMFDARLR